MKAVAAMALAALAAALVSIPVSAVPIGTMIDVNGTDITSALNCTLSGIQTVCRGTNYSGGVYSLGDWEFLFNPDPSILGSFTLTNLSNMTQTFSVSATLGGLSVGSPIAISGSVGPGTLTDVNGGGAELTIVTPYALYAARIDGLDAQTLLDGPQDFVVPNNNSGGSGGSVPIGPASFGPSILAQSVSSSIGVAFESFTLTAGDSVTLPFAFDVIPTTVPEPATLALLGLALAGLGFSRRCKLH